MNTVFGPSVKGRAIHTLWLVCQREGAPPSLMYLDPRPGDLQKRAFQTAEGQACSTDKDLNTMLGSETGNAHAQKIIWEIPSRLSMNCSFKDREEC